MNAKVLEKKFIVPFVLITSLFALWGFANDITNPMVAVFQTVMEIPASEAALVQLAFMEDTAQWLFQRHYLPVAIATKRGFFWGLLFMQ